MLARVMDNEFKLEHQVTIGVEFGSFVIKLDGKIVKLQIWDTAGQEKYNSINFTYYRGTNCCILVFDLSDDYSFENLEKWKKEFLQKANPKNPANFPFVVIGNKTDLFRRVPEGVAREWCRTQGNVSYYETWGEQNIMVDSAFYRAAELCVKEMEDQNYGNQMPLGLGQAQGAIKMNAQDDARRSKAIREQTKSDSCC